MNTFELYEQIMKLSKEFDIFPSSGVRDWSEALGINPKVNPEEFIRRAIIACSQQFNFREGNILGLSAESIMQWVRNGYEAEQLLNFNLVDKRIRLFADVQYVLCQNNLLHRITDFFFWKELSYLYGNDPVNKRLNLLRMILKDSGFKIYSHKRINIAIDYNILAVLKYVGAIDYKGDFKDTQEEVNKIRKLAYIRIWNLITKKNQSDTYIDGLLFFLGRELRKRNLVNVCLYKGCTDY